MSIGEESTPCNNSSNGDTEEVASAVAEEDIGLSPDEIQEAQKRLAELEEKLKAVDILEAKQLEAVKKLTNMQMDYKVKELQNSVQQKMDERMSGVQNRYGAHALESIGGRQTDLLRMNKTIREISRQLPAELWADLYDMLTSKLEDRSKVATEKDRIEQCRSFMRAYVCLISWRDQCGDFCDISTLPVALRSLDQQELANTADEILKSEGDNLFTIRRPGVDKKVRPSRPMSVMMSSLEDQQNVPSPLRRSASLRAKNENIEGYLGNRKLLKVAKTFKEHQHWRSLADRLQINKEEIEDLVKSGDDCSTCTFKLLFSWRVTLGDVKSEHVDYLEKVLKEEGKLDSVKALHS